MVKNVDGSLNWKLIGPLIGVILTLVSVLWGINYSMLGNKVDREVYISDRKGIDEKLTRIDKRQEENGKRQEAIGEAIKRIEIDLARDRGR